MPLALRPAFLRPITHLAPGIAMSPGGGALIYDLPGCGRSDVVRSQRHCRWQRLAQAAGLRHQHGDVVGAIDERRSSAASPEITWWWYFGASVDASHLTGEAAGDRHPPRRDAADRVDVGMLRPGQRRSDGDCGQTGGVQNSNEPG